MRAESLWQDSVSRKLAKDGSAFLNLVQMQVLAINKLEAKSYP